MLWSPKETSEVVIKWLEKGQEGGKLDEEFKERMITSDVVKSKLD